ncbi:MAG: FAD:protein FMN transferase, partial [Chloroflexi bacterium]|nr:FAD:protein FMN transferase [Chloroflexota bacterium]
GRGSACPTPTRGRRSRSTAATRTASADAHHQGFLMTTFTPPSSAVATARHTYNEVLEFRAMGTAWWIGADGVDRETLAAVPALVELEEQRCSRFRAHSLLSRLNAARLVTDTSLAAIVRAALLVQERTGGAFDVAVGDAVIASGYDRTFEALTGCAGPAPQSDVEVAVDGDRAWLLGAGTIDLGGIAKGWTADLVGRHLADCGATRWLVDAGGDIVAGGRPGLCREEPIAVGFTGYTVGIEVGAVATSSTTRRAWDTPLGRMHDIVAPATGRPAEGPHVLATVVAPTAMVADALATAMLADATLAIGALAAYDADVLLIDGQGGATMTPGMERYLR